VAARSSADVIAAFEDAHAAIFPVYSMPDLVADRHVQARGVLQSVDGITMQGPVARLSKTPAVLRHAGPKTNADAAEIQAEIS
jgi:formyl-CoA transferase